VFGRKAGTAAGFHRYSDARRSVDLVWREDTLDAFLADPQGYLPGNRMTFPGIEEQAVRAEVIAFLQIATAGGAQAEAEGPPAEQGQDGMMGGMMAAPGGLADLKTLGPDQQVTAIRYCGDTYHVTTAAGEALPFWEFNLRFKTDSSDKGPPPGQPMLLPASMMGDRAFVIFADPAEISAFIESKSSKPKGERHAHPARCDGSGDRIRQRTGQGRATLRGDPVQDPAVRLLRGLRRSPARERL
jgi:cytochrome c